MNSNWLQEFDVPIGADNNIEPGGPDQGQPTHFYPRRNPFLFTIKVPKDLGTKELVWTLTANGKTEKAYASLKTDYQIDAQVISTEVGGDFGSLRDELRTNLPPKLEAEAQKQYDVWKEMILSARGLVVTPASEIAAEEVRWLWPGRFPLKHLSILAGAADVGKTLLALDMAARVSRGLAWPDAPDQPHRPANVLFITTHDNTATSIVPRLKRAGADLDRVFIVNGVPRPEATGMAFWSSAARSSSITG